MQGRAYIVCTQPYRIQRQFGLYVSTLVRGKSTTSIQTLNVAHVFNILWPASRGKQKPESNDSGANTWRRLRKKAVKTTTCDNSNVNELETEEEPFEDARSLKRNTDHAGFGT